MKILFLMIAYPNIEVNSSMYTDLANEFALHGHDVFVAAANGKHKTTLRLEGNVTVLRVRTMELFKTSFVLKGIANIRLPNKVSNAIRKYFGKIVFDVVIASTPPITYLKTIKKLKDISNAKVYLILRDIFPQNAKDLKLINNPFLFKYFRSKEKELYSISDFIGCMSNGNISYVKQNNPNVSPKKLHLLMNWKNVTEYSVPDYSLKKQYGLENKYIALYGGNIGKPQQVEFILELAKEMQKLSDVIFFIIGDGTEKKKVVDLVTKNNLKNVIVKEPLPRYQYQEVVKFCNVGMVNINSSFTIPNIPSRTLSYWEAKLPVLASIDQHTDFSSILDESASGLWSITGDIQTYKKNFEMLYHNKQLRTTMGENGYNYLLNNCTTAHAYSIITGKLFSKKNAK